MCILDSAEKPRLDWPPRRQGAKKEGEATSFLVRQVLELKSPSESWPPALEMVVTGRLVVLVVNQSLCSDELVLVTVIEWSTTPRR